MDLGTSARFCGTHFSYRMCAAAQCKWPLAVELAPTTCHRYILLLVYLFDRVNFNNLKNFKIIVFVMHIRYFMYPYFISITIFTFMLEHSGPTDVPTDNGHAEWEWQRNQKPENNNHWSNSLRKRTCVRARSHVCECVCLRSMHNVRCTICTTDIKHFRIFIHCDFVKVAFGSNTFRCLLTQ